MQKLQKIIRLHCFKMNCSAFSFANWKRGWVQQPANWVLDQEDLFKFMKQNKTSTSVRVLL